MALLPGLPSAPLRAGLGWQPIGSGRFVPKSELLLPSAPYNVRRSSASGPAGEEEAPFSSEEQKRRYRCPHLLSPSPTRSGLGQFRGSS